MSNPCVSVLVPTFNHAPFIAEALDSVLSQETTFPFEVLVGDDCSTDGSSEVIEDYVRKNPGIVRCIAPESNQGGHANFSRLYRESRGRYVALLEGDDFWAAPGKLQRQVDFLDANPEFAICAHRVRQVFEDGSGRHDAVTNLADPPVSGLDRITRFNYVWTASCVFRNGLISDLPAWVHSLPLGDWPLFVLLAEHGEIRILDEVMAVYRIHTEGVWARRTQQGRLIATVRVAEVMKRHLGHPGFDDCIFKTSRKIARTAWKNRNWKRALRYWGKCAGIALKRPQHASEAFKKDWRDRNSETAA